MKKSTHSNPEMSNNSSTKEQDHKALPTSPKKETINNILAFAKSYSVRKGKIIEKMEFMLN